MGTIGAHAHLQAIDAPDLAATAHATKPHVKRLCAERTERVATWVFPKQ
jgi:hypothetical protein